MGDISTHNVFRDLERPLILATLWILTGAFLIGILVNNLLLDLSRELNIVLVGGASVNLILLFIFRGGKHQILIKYTLIVMIWIFLDVSWYLNFGFKGAITLLFPLFFAMIVLMVNRKEAIFCAILLLMNLIIFFIIEMNWPEFTADYNTTQERVTDNFVSLIIGGALLAIFLGITKKGYRQEFLKAKKSEELKSAFLANMSHEIRTPLNAIMGFSELLKEDGTAKINEKYIDIIYNNSDYLHELIDKVLNLSLIESGNITFYPEVFLLKKLLDRLQHENQIDVDQNRAGHLTVRVLMNNPELKIKTDRIRLEQVLKNLLTNAMKFTEEGEIVFGVDFVEDQYLFFVQDTGRGISTKDLPNIFKRFVKLDTGDHKNLRGAGLGLYLCHQIITKLGGEMRVTSKADKGSTFHFTLPGPVQD